MLSRRQAFATLATMLPAGSVSAADEEKPDVEELVKLLADAVKYLQLTSPPIGSVQAFAGDWPPRKADGTKWTELDIGWLLCDGRKINDVQAELHKELEKQKKKIPEDGVLSELRAILPRLKNGPPEALPDYRGYFLRGVDRGISGLVAGRDKDENRAVGQEQRWATANPMAKFSAKDAGEHVHSLSTRFNAGTNPNANGAEVTVHDKAWTNPGQGMKPAGKHSHEITGGDAETRPINMAVYYIIKFQ